MALDLKTFLKAEILLLIQYKQTRFMQVHRYVQIWK